MERLVVPAVRDFRPDLLVVANGQDANQFDPNGRQCGTMAGFHRLGGIARELAREACGGRMLIVQEGGYNTAYAAFCAHATVEGFLGLPPGLGDPIAYLPDDRAERIVTELSERLN
jgi:acetoin utilization deacetylase AcuC-like enzyme